MMALIKCVECGKQISSKAAACPHCGCPLEHEEVKKNNDTSVEVIRRVNIWSAILSLSYCIVLFIFFIGTKIDRYVILSVLDNYVQDGFYLYLFYGIMVFISFIVSLFPRGVNISRIGYFISLILYICTFSCLKSSGYEIGFEYIFPLVFLSVLILNTNKFKIIEREVIISPNELPSLIKKNERNIKPVKKLNKIAFSILLGILVIIAGISTYLYVFAGNSVSNSNTSEVKHTQKKKNYVQIFEDTLIELGYTEVDSGIYKIIYDGVATYIDLNEYMIYGSMYDDESGITLTTAYYYNDNAGISYATFDLNGYSIEVTDYYDYSTGSITCTINYNEYYSYFCDYSSKENARSTIDSLKHLLEIAFEKSGVTAEQLVNSSSASI